MAMFMIWSAVGSSMVFAVCLVSYFHVYVLVSYCKIRKPIVEPMMMIYEVTYGS